MKLWKRIRGKNDSDSTEPRAEVVERGVDKDRVVRVFVSSTFRDMVEDRNELMAQVWPALRRVCRGRAVEFVDVDLRWGVTEEQSQRRETVRHCLAEIKRCRPYFIGLLGERYGWVPGAEAYSQTLLEEEPWLEREVAKRSVTELEILHGVLNDPEMAGRSFFYFRDPRYAQTHGGDYQAENTADASRQTALKERVRTVCHAKGIPLREGYADPRALAALVLADLNAAIDAEFPPDQVPDAWAREDRDHETYAESRRTEFYVGRDAYFNQLDAFVRGGADDSGLTVLGESGGGKSALLANWVARWREANPRDFVFQHYVGSSPMSAGHLALMRRLMVAIVRWCVDGSTPGDRRAEEDRIPAEAEEIVKLFPDYLNRLAVRAKQNDVRAVVVLDAINQLEDQHRGRLLAWLPNRLPDEVRLILSTVPSDTLDALQPRAWPAITVEPLMAEERVRFIACYLAHFAQGLSDVRARKIAGVAAASNPLYLKTLLDDLRVTGVHDQLDAQIDDYLQASDIPSLLGKILGRYERDYDRERPGLVGEALSLLWASRRGLTEPELLEVLKPAGRDRLPTALWSPIRCAIADSLVDHDGVLNFAHEHVRTAVQRRYVPESNTARALRVRLADEFGGRPTDARQADEFPWLLRQAEARDRLRTCLLDIDRFLLILERDEDELRRYWVWLQEEQVMGKAYLDAFESWATQPGREDHSIAQVASRLALFLFRAGRPAEAEPLFRRALAINGQRFGTGHPRVVGVLSDLGLLLYTTCRPLEAEPLYRRALAIHERTSGLDCPEVGDVLRGLAVVLQATNRRAKAERCFRRALAVYERSLGPDHPNVARALSDLALFLYQCDRMTESEPLYRRALAIDERNYGPDQPVVAIALNNLAMLFQATDRLSEAERFYRRALAIDERSFGSHHHLTVAVDLNNLATLFYTTNRLAEAEPLFRRAMAVDESFWPDHRTVVHILYNFAGLLYRTGRIAEAEPLMRRRAEIALRSQATTECEQFVSEYRELLLEMGRSPREVQAELNTLGRRSPGVPNDIGQAELNSYLAERSREASNSVFVRVLLPSLVAGGLVSLVASMRWGWPWGFLAFAGGSASAFVFLAFYYAVRSKARGLLYSCPRCRSPIFLNSQVPSSAWECPRCHFNHFRYWREAKTRRSLRDC